jgi:hypothetical protein
MDDSRGPLPVQVCQFVRHQADEVSDGHTRTTSS